MEGVQRGFQSERKGKAIPRRGAEDRKGAETKSGTFSTRNPEVMRVSEAERRVQEGV